MEKNSSISLKIISPKILENLRFLQKSWNYMLHEVFRAKIKKIGKNKNFKFFENFYIPPPTNAKKKEKSNKMDF